MRPAPAAVPLLRKALLRSVLAAGAAIAAGRAALVAGREG